MKKILLLSVAFIATLFTACEKEGATSDYTVEINPTTISMSSGENFTITVTGEGAEDIQWMSCYEYAEDAMVGSCLPFNNGNILELPTSLFSIAGEYEIHTYSDAADIDLGRITITVTE